VTIDKKFTRLYKSELADWFESIEDFCRKKNIDYIRSGNLISIEEFLLKYLRQGGMIG
jgi:hypothetical protein